MVDTQDIGAIMRLHDELNTVRCNVHSHLELGLKETRTAALMAVKLREFGIGVTERVGGTGVVSTHAGDLNRMQKIGRLSSY